MTEEENGLPLYTLEQGSLEPVPTTSYMEANVFEVRDLQPAIIKAIDAVAPGTLVIDKEHRGWEGKDLRIDILGIDKDGHPVVIELKRTDDGGALDLQALRYAAMVSTYTYERVVEVFESYLSKSGRPTEDADRLLREHMGFEGASEAAIDVDVTNVSAGGANATAVETIFGLRSITFVFGRLSRNSTCFGTL